MKMFRHLLLREFVPFLILGVMMFGVVLFLADVFGNLWRYLNQDVPFSRAILVSLMYAPKILTFALPIGSMFGAAFALGNLGSRNELIAVFGSGVPLRRFIRPILIIAALMSVGLYFLEDNFAIAMMKRRNQLSQELLGTQTSRNRSRATAISHGGKIIYYADYYNDDSKTLTGLTVVILDEENYFVKRIDAEQAVWDGEWVLSGCRIFTVAPDGDIVQQEQNRYTDELLDEEFTTFRLDTRDIEEMNGAEARAWIETQKRAGLPYKKYQAEYYQRFTLALTPFLVVLFAGVLGGRFKRNVLLMSLLASLGLSSAWYVIRMIFTLFSENSNLISPLAGAVVPYLAFLALGIWLFRYAKT